ncbi:Uncharacterised protein [Serratia fonticola]|uniref:Uncharacterized protein n=1 Tax=Serratia fonticola TaxID=47917 RepID=A0A4U9VQY9_SERFO|nr:Uncharacterised protein [Serratia fonticola]
MKQLQETYNGIMAPAPAVVSEEPKTGGCGYRSTGSQRTVIIAPHPNPLPQGEGAARRA